jgi:tetratricopeptide (TPR) repeat protein
MKHARSIVYTSLRWLTLLGALTALTGHADEYADTNQLVRANKFTEALAKVDSYLAGKPADPQMRFLKGVIQRNLGKPAEAIATFTLLTQDYPELPEPYNNLAVLYAGQGQYDKARVTLEMAIAPTRTTPPPTKTWVMSMSGWPVSPTTRPCCSTVATPQSPPN